MIRRVDLGLRTLTVGSLDPLGAVVVWGNDGGDISAEVQVLDAAPWSFVLVVHPDNSVTVPSEADSLIIDVS